MRGWRPRPPPGWWTSTWTRRFPARLISGPWSCSEVAEYVRTLEEAKDTAELPEASGEAIAREFERYLRRHERRRRGGTEDGPT